MQLGGNGTLAVEGIADAAIKARQAQLQVVASALAGGGVERFHHRKALCPIRPKEAVVEAGVELLDHRLGHGPITLQGPGFALLQRCGEPPADPLHRPGQL